MLLQSLNPYIAVIVTTVLDLLVIGSLILQISDKRLHLSDVKLEGSLGLVELVLHEADAIIQLVNLSESVLGLGVSW